MRSLLTERHPPLPGKAAFSTDVNYSGAEEWLCVLSGLFWLCSNLRLPLNGETEEKL